MFDVMIILVVQGLGGNITSLLRLSDARWGFDSLEIPNSLNESSKQVLCCYCVSRQELDKKINTRCL